MTSVNNNECQTIPNIQQTNDLYSDSVFTSPRNMYEVIPQDPYIVTWVLTDAPVEDGITVDTFKTEFEKYQHIPVRGIFLKIDYKSQKSEKVYHLIEQAEEVIPGRSVDNLSNQITSINSNEWISTNMKSILQIFNSASIIAAYNSDAMLGILAKYIGQSEMTYWRLKTIDVYYEMGFTSPHNKKETRSYPKVYSSYPKIDLDMICVWNNIEYSSYRNIRNQLWPNQKPIRNSPQMITLLLSYADAYFEIIVQLYFKKIIIDRKTLQIRSRPSTRYQEKTYNMNIDFHINI